MMPRGRPRVEDTDLPRYVYYDKTREVYIIKNPLGETRVKWERDRKRAIAIGKKLNEVVETKRQADLLNAGQVTIAAVVDKFLYDRLDKTGWKESTKKDNVYKFARIKKELGHRFITRTDSKFLTEWLNGFCHNADQFNGWRYMLILLWRFAKSLKMVESNEAEAVLEESGSLNIVSNRKSRQGLTLEGYGAVYEWAKPWLKLAMDISFICMLGRFEVCNMRHADFRGDWLYVIRQKTSSKSKEAFLRYPVSAVLREIRVRAMTLDGIDAPNLVHREPDRDRADWEVPAGEQASYVRPQYLTNSFAQVRDACGFFKDLEPHELPSFHEIRGLAARRYEDLGMEKMEIQAMLAHASPAATKVYLEGGKAALQDDHYAIVEAPLSLTDLRGV
jgi:integrase